MVVIFRTTAQQSGGSWPRSGARKSGLYVANLFVVRASPRDAPLGAGLRVPICGLVIDRDRNGSKNILDEALEAVGRHGRIIPKPPAREPWGVVT